MDTNRLYRSKNDVMIGGVAAGLANYFKVDPTLVRLGLVLLAFFTAVVPVVLLYVIMWAVMPKNPA